MKVLVTGADGFIGGSVCKHLAAAGHKIIAGLRSERPDQGWMETLVYGNLETQQRFSPSLEGIDAVVHLAARVHITREKSADVEAVYRRVNTEITEKIATKAAKAGVKRFVFLSSVKVNGESTQTEPFSEENAPAPEDAYGRSKLAAERALQRISENTKLACTSLRVPLVYGPGVKANFEALLRFCGLPIPLPLGGITNNQRSLLFTGNLTDAIRTVLENPTDHSESFLLSDGENLSTADLVWRLRQSLRQPAPNLKVPVSVLRTFAGLTNRETTVRKLCDSLEIDSSRFSQTFDWTPAFTVDQGIAATAAWYRAQRKLSPIHNKKNKTS